VLSIRLEAPCRPTESPSKVRLAILNIFPDAELEENDLIRGEARSLHRLSELLRGQRIRDSAREVLMGSIRGNRVVFHINKQAAFAGRVSFSAHSSLGDILVAIEVDDPRQVVDQLAPRSPRQP
jgi:predicted RNA binding protein with dsRBD fold (UPF0201 family)